MEARARAEAREAEGVRPAARASRASARWASRVALASCQMFERNGCNAAYGCV